MLLATYTRFSSDMQRHESITAQLRAINEWAQKQGHIIVKNYIDEAISGRTDDRPQFQQMIKDSYSAEWQGIVVHKLDRFARNRYDSAIYKKQLKDNKKVILSVTENLDGSAESIILEALLEGMSEYYSVNLGRETAKGHRENAYMCKHNGGIPLLGYDIDENLNYVINETEAMAVKLIFDMYAKGYSMRQIIEKLNADGYRTKRGNAFGKNSLYDLLHNEKYTGKYIFGYGGRQKNRNRPNADVIIKENGMPAIISEEVWQMVQNRRRTNSTATNKAKRVYILTGILFCGLCGESYFGNSNGRDYKYMCKKRANKLNCNNISINKDELEQYILKNIYSLVDNSVSDELLDRINTLYSKTREEAVSELKTTTVKLTAINTKISNLVNIIANGNTLPSLVAELSKLEDEKTILENKIELLNNIETKESINKTFISKMLSGELENISKLPPEEQKITLAKYINKIFIFPDRIEIELKIDNKKISNKNVGYDWWAEVDSNHRTR